MIDNILPFRQIHLDFHTSEKICNVGKDFDGEEFARTLHDAGVNSVTCFARCHHGMLYYDSKKFPERIHPGLKNKNLLKEQIEYCHKYGIRVPIYITVQWDYYTASHNPNWLCLNEDGSVSGWKPYQAGFYANLCVNTGYIDFLKEHTAEVLETLDTDGIFFDIVNVRECSCITCRQNMVNEGLEPSNKLDRIKYARMTINRFKHEMTSFVRKFNNDCTIFYNSGHVDHTIMNSINAYTHLELESLPGGGWGYMHFPVTMRYARNVNDECIGMTGKFHTTWGDFHSFKNIAALEYECFNMLALNGKCSIGDQLEPGGRLSPPVYDLIGNVYRSVIEKEPWCVKARQVVEIGVLVNEEHVGHGQGGIDSASLGVARILQEGSYQFDFIDRFMDFSKYKIIILPDVIQPNDTLQTLLSEFINSGGKVLASYKSGLKDSRFFLDFGVVVLKDQTCDLISGEEVSGKKYAGNAYADYILPKGLIAGGLPSTLLVMYMKGLQVKAKDTKYVLAEVYKSYFNRDYRHFCSHNQTPCSGEPEYDGIVITDNTVYFAHPIFTQYAQNAPYWCKKLIFNALDMLLPNRLVEHSGPSTVVTTLNEQKDKNRYILHVLHYIPERRSYDMDIIEDKIPLYNISFKVYAGKNIKTVSCVPDRVEINFKLNDGYVDFTLPVVCGHQMVEITW